MALAAGAISFARDAHALLLGPLERILVKLEAIHAIQRCKVCWWNIGCSDYSILRALSQRAAESLTLFALHRALAWVLLFPRRYGR